MISLSLSAFALRRNPCVACACTTLYETRFGLQVCIAGDAESKKFLWVALMYLRSFTRSNPNKWPGRQIFRMADREGHNHVVGW